MANPWEEYQQESGPWDEYQQEYNMAGSVVDKVENKMPEGLQGRTFVKNFGGDPVAVYAYLKKANPDFEFGLEPDHSIKVRKKGSETWGRLDPSGMNFENLKDFPNDVKDVAFDIPAGFVQGTATAMGGLAGGLPGAMGAGAASSAAIEGLRQSIGAAFGLGKENYDPMQAVIATGVGAGAPLALGTGASGKQILAQSLKPGATKTAKEIAESQKGLIRRLIYDPIIADRIAPSVGSALSGEKKSVIKNAGSMLDEIAAADKNPEVRTERLLDIKKDVPKKLNRVRMDTGAEIGKLVDSIDNAPGLVKVVDGQPVQTGSIPSKELLQPFLELTEKLKASSSKTEGQTKDLEALGSLINSEFSGLPEYITAKQAVALGDRFKTLAKKFGLNYNQMGQAQGSFSNMSAIDSQIAYAFEGARRKVTDSIVNRLEQIDPKLAQRYAVLSDNYSHLKELSKQVNSNFKSTKSVDNFLSKAINNDVDATTANELQRVTGIDLQKAALDNQTLKTFSKPSSDIRSLGGTTSTSKTTPLQVAGGVGGWALGQRLGWSPYLTSVIGAIGGGKVASPASMRGYMELNRYLLDTLPQSTLGNPAYRGIPYYLMRNEQDATKKIKEEEQKP